MRLIPSAIGRTLHTIRVRRRFPESSVHNSVAVDALSSLGKSAVLFSNVRLVESTLGRYSYMQESSSAYSAEIGPFCSIAAHVTIGLANHPTALVSTSPVFYDSTQPLPHFFVKESTRPSILARTIIGADVWIGEGVKIVAGVRIGTGAVIGAGAIVTRDIPPYTVAAGVPCRSLRTRFDEPTCRRLLASRWWEFDENQLDTLGTLFNDPLALLEAIEE